MFIIVVIVIIANVLICLSSMLCYKETETIHLAEKVLATVLKILKFVMYPLAKNLYEQINCQKIFKEQYFYYCAGEDS